MGRDLLRPDFLDLEGTLFDGRFRVERYVAEGGFAVVYRAFQVALDRRVALKILKAPLNALQQGSRLEFHERFAAEARTIARLRHPHIVGVHDFSVAELPDKSLVPWMALEWLNGETLATRLARRREGGARGLLPREAVALLRPVLEALAYAHEQGVVHRDIKPANIMMSVTPNGESLRVLDFGIAKIVAADYFPRTGDTRTESVPAFSPAYAAPEQVAFSRTGTWTDVHALGLLLTELMTDEPPFSGSDPDAHVFEQVMSTTRPTPGIKGRDVGAFESTIAKAVAVAPRARWRNAGELLAALDDAASSETWHRVSKEPGGANGANGGRSWQSRPGRARRWLPLALASIAAVAGATGLVRVRAKRSKLRSASVSSPAVAPDGSPCVGHMPELSLSPEEGPSVQAGTLVPFKLGITNRSPVGCPADTAHCTALFPWPLVNDEDGFQLDVPAGQTAYATVNIGSLRSAKVGKYPFHVNVQMESTNDRSVAFRSMAFVGGSYVVGSPIASTGVALDIGADGTFDRQNDAGVVGGWWAVGDAYGSDGTSGTGTCPRAGFPTSACSVINAPRLEHPFRPDPSGRGMCTSGVVAPVVAGKDGKLAFGPIWGAAIGFDLANSGQLRPYDAVAHGITGVAFDIDVVPEAGHLRISFLMPGRVGNSPYWRGAKRGYSPVYTPGRYEIRWSEVDGPVWEPNLPLFDPRKLESVNFSITAAYAPTPYSFCIKNVEMLTN